MHIESHFIFHPKLVKVVVTRIKVSRAIYKDSPWLCRNQINHLTLDPVLGLLNDFGDINIHLFFLKKKFLPHLLRPQLNSLLRQTISAHVMFYISLNF